MLGGAADEQLARVRAVVERFAAADVEDLETMIYLGRREQL